MSEQPHLTEEEWAAFDDVVRSVGDDTEEISHIEEKLMAQMYRRYTPRCPAYDRFRRSLVPSIANAVAEFRAENESMDLDKATFRNITSFDISALLDSEGEWARSDD